jgi:hypothetical protein
MKTYLHCCIYHEHNSLKIHWNENLTIKFVQKRDAQILCSMNICCKSNRLCDNEINNRVFIRTATDCVHLMSTCSVNSSRLVLLRHKLKMHAQAFTN